MLATRVWKERCARGWQACGRAITGAGSQSGVQREHGTVVSHDRQTDFRARVLNGAKVV